MVSSDDVTESCITDLSSTVTLLIIGARIVDGSSAFFESILFWASEMDLSMSVPYVNDTKTIDMPSKENDRIDSMPCKDESASSSLRVREFSTSVGEAPG